MSNLRNELALALDREQYDLTDEGVYFPRQGVLAAGEYFDRINGGEWQRTKNLIPTEGLAHILNVAMGSTAKPAGYFLALFSGAAAPAANWTAASFAAAASEIVSLTEGYTNATKPPVAADSGRQVANVLPSPPSPAQQPLPPAVENVSPAPINRDFR